jgi:hypothetical protein
MNEPDDLITTALSDLARQAAPPRLSPEALWRAGRRRRWTAITTAAAGAAAATAAAALVPFAVLSAPSHPAPSSPVSAAAGTHRPPPIQLRQVARVTHHRCPPGSPGLPGTSKDECFYLTHTGMAISKFTSVTIINPQPGAAKVYWLNFRLQRADIGRFTHLTRKLANSPGPRNQMAFIVNGVVLLDPTVPAPIAVGVFQIATGNSRAQAQALLYKVEHA